MGLASWRTGLVGRTAHARIRIFNVPIGGGVLAPSRSVEGGVAPVLHELHIHTALVEAAGKEASDGDGGPSVTHANWDTDRDQLTRGAPGAVPVVFMHGYGSGIGIFSQVLPAMPSAYTSGPVYAIDTLGCGLSSRPPATDGHWGDMTVRQAENFFVVDGIERWRAAMGFSKLRLVGHSIGGYLAVTYAEKFPERVEQVVTIGCAGVPSIPDDFEVKMRSRWPWLAPLAISFWNNKVSPFNIMRWGPGTFFFERYSRRWEGLPWFTNINHLRDYLLANFTLGEVSAGGYAHVTLLDLAAFAKDPLHARIPHLQLERPLTMVYGESDWMNPSHAFELRDKLHAKRAESMVVVEVATISQGGHNIPLENPTGLVDALSDALGGIAVDDKVYAGSWSPPVDKHVSATSKMETARQTQSV